jgi:hypothetical protein
MPIAPEDLARAESLDQIPSPWVVFTATKIFPTGVELVESRTGVKHTKAKYYLVQVGDRWMVAALRPNHKGKVVAGELSASRRGLANQAWHKVTTDTSGIHQGRLVPFHLEDYIDYGENWRYGFYLFAGVAGFGALFLLYAGWNGVAMFLLPAKAPAPPPASVPQSAEDWDRLFTLPK